MNQFQPVYSPDGKWIAYVSWSDTIGGHLWRVPSQGGSPEQITTVAGLYQHPSWSPDGKTIAVVKGRNQIERSDEIRQEHVLFYPSFLYFDRNNY